MEDPEYTNTSQYGKCIVKEEKKLNEAGGSGRSQITGAVKVISKTPGVQSVEFLRQRGESSYIKKRTKYIYRERSAGEWDLGIQNY